MPLSPPSHVQSILILKADRLYAESLRQLTLLEFPGASLRLTTTIATAEAAIATERVDLLVTGLEASLEGDVLDLLSRLAGSSSRPRRVMVVTVRREYRVLAALRTLGVEGVFDCTTELPKAFGLALHTVTGGARFWSASLVEYMRRVGSASTALFRLLTAFEQVVLSVIGDGCDDLVAARLLGLSPSTVSTVRRELHRKLGVQHRGELVRAAAQHGFVRFTPAGVVRPGFALLAAAYQAKRTRVPVTEPPAFSTPPGARFQSAR